MGFPPCLPKLASGMCGRYSLINPSRLAKAFPRLRAGTFAELGKPRYNIAPTQDVLGARDGGRDAIEALRWGLHGRTSTCEAERR